MPFSNKRAAIESLHEAVAFLTNNCGMTAQDVRGEVQEALEQNICDDSTKALIDKYGHCFIPEGSPAVTTAYIQLYMSNLIDGARGKREYI